MIINMEYWKYLPNSAPKKYWKWEEKRRMAWINTTRIMAQVICYKFKGLQSCELCKKNYKCY
jgi:hypothetical protein